MKIIRVIHVCISIGVLILSGLVPGHGRAQSTDLAQGKKLFEKCADCHGKKAEGIIDKAPRLNGQQNWYLRTQIEKFRAGYRGYSQDSDKYGVMMRDVAQHLKSQNTIDNVLAYIGTMALVAPEATIKGGDAVKGKEFWLNNCTFCHGKNGEGRKDLESPRLAGQSDWYLLRQMASYRAGLRGSHKKDPRGKMMQSMSLLSNDDQAVLDVVTYLSRMR